MRDFYQQRFQILLCSTIIETGIDVANANTILINRADKFGLAQLHQLRGRVGRSHHQAYAYLLIPWRGRDHRRCQEAAGAITQLEDLGAGFYLSMHDLEIRGAGEVLGDNQSGEMQEIGSRCTARCSTRPCGRSRQAASPISTNRSVSPPRSTSHASAPAQTTIARAYTSGW